MFGQYKHIDQIGECGEIGNDAGEGNLRGAEKATEAERVFDGLLYGGQWYAFCPSRLIRQESMNERDIEVRFVASDPKSVEAVGHVAVALLVELAGLPSCLHIGYQQFLELLQTGNLEMWCDA